MWGMFKFLIAVWRAAVQMMDPNRNALRHAPASIKYGASILLACLWCLAFGIYIGELWSIGYNMLGHVFIVTMVFVTWSVFQSISRKYPERGLYDELRDPDRVPKCYEMTEQERLEALNRNRT